jgi:hypothetical protein
VPETCTVSPTRTAREYPMIGSYFVPVEIFVRFMVASFPGLKWGLFCHEHVLVEKLDNASRIHLSWSRAEEKL